MQLVWGAATDRGLHRPVNEDAYLAEPPVFLVADGMGGHEAGALASQTTLACFERFVGQSSVEPAEVAEALREAVARVRAIETNTFEAGSTLTGVVVTTSASQPYWLVVNVGDSRTYRLDAAGLHQITVDHSEVQLLLDQGRITEAQAATHPHRNVVTRAVGAGAEAEPDYWLLPAAEGERMLICSDGLTKEVDTARIEEVLRQEPSAEAASTRLVHEALARGGHDNITAIVVDVSEVPVSDDLTTVSSLEESLDDDTREVPC